MRDLPIALIGLFCGWVAITGALVALVSYRASLSRGEDDSLYLNKAEEILLTSGEHDVLVARMESLRRPIMALTLASGVVLLVSTGFWLWSGFRSF